jgi:hypothetical protein
MELTDKDIEQKKAENIFKIINSAEQLRNWIYTYFDLYMPMGHIDPESNSSPIEGMWEIYKAVRDNKGDEVPGFILLSCRFGFKTLSTSILEILLMIHFRVTIAHCAAIEFQSQKAVEYCDTFLNKILPYLQRYGWKKISDNKRRIELQTDKKEKVYIQIIILTIKGANSSHTNIMCVDEIDLCDPKAYEQAKLIPSASKGRHPIRIKLSTRKFAFGLMEKAIQDCSINNEKLLRWNLLDVAEHCPKKRCLSDLPIIKRYICRQLPLRQASPEEFNSLNDEEKHNWEEIDAYQGCVKCSLLPVCKKALHDKTTRNQTGDLWYPLSSIISSINQVTPEVAEAEILCHKPSTKGLIYPRFNNKNVLTVQEAWTKLTGLTNICSFDMLVDYIKNLGIEIQTGLDWGYTNEFAVVVAAILSKNEILILDTFAAPNLELEDCVKICTELRDKYKISKFWCDQAYPAYIKTFNRKGLKCPPFTKDVAIGIEAVRGKIIDSSNKRYMYILDTENNKRLIKGFSTYHWKINGQGESTDQIDHTEESDIMDALRYLFQNLFGIAKKVFFSMTNAKKPIFSNNEDIMANKVKELATETIKKDEKETKKKVFWL